MPAPGVEIRIADNGEVLVRGPMLLKEYYKRPDATAESIDADGYFHTGDAGVIDDDGQLKIIDRAKDVGKLASGAMFAPNYIENKLKFFPHIKEAVAFGNERDTRVRVHQHRHAARSATGRSAAASPYSGYTDLAQKPEVYELDPRMRREGQRRARAAKASLAASQIHRFLILHKELDPDDDELTRTRKVRRGFVAREVRGADRRALRAARPSSTSRRWSSSRTAAAGMVAADLDDRRSEDVPRRRARAKAA